MKEQSSIQGVGTSGYAYENRRQEDPYLIRDLKIKSKGYTTSRRKWEKIFCDLSLGQDFSVTPKAKFKTCS